ncbi:MAG: hypothetical protein KF767_06625 [Bdellovibrionaceae bacterium]|nr:hypothetical protein [Pseudobdellovibrionaceae bacterium]
MKIFAPVLVLSLTTFALTTAAQAQSFTVKKVKGKQAIVQMTSGSFSEGQTVSVGGGEASSSYSSGGSAGSRNKFIGLEGRFTSTKVTVNNQSSTTTGIGLLATYGWNKLTMEYGVIGGVTINSGGGSNSTDLEVGGVFDYNFTENRPGNDGILFVGANATFGSNSGGATSTTTIKIYPHVGYKMFALGNATAIRFHLGMQLLQTSGGGASGSDTQPLGGVGLQTYF